jgi:APA family basic amino acid/polyamine antiporter
MSPGEVDIIPEACPAEEPSLKGKLGWWYLFAMATASIIGPWVVMSQFWYSVSGPSIALAFVVVGIICIPIGMVYGELSAMFPKVGGSFVFVKRGFGVEASYWVTWALLLSYLALMAYMLSSLATIIQIMWIPDLTGETIMIVSCLMAILVFGLTWRKVDLSATLQFYMFVFTIIVGFGYLILFVFSPSFDPSTNWNPFFAFGTAGFLQGVGLMITMYFGFELIPQFAEECDYPHAKHWKVMVWSVVAAMALYTTISLVETAMAPLDELLAMPNFIAGVLSEQLYGLWLEYLVVFANIATLIGCIIGFWLGASRVLFAMGREGIMPQIFYKVNKHHQPYIGNIVILLVTLFFIIYCYLAGTNWVVALYTLMAIGVAIAYASTSAAYVRLKYTMKDRPRPWKAPGGVVMGVAATVAGIFITYEVFSFFYSDVWILFISYFVIGFVIRLYLLWDSRKHPEQFTKARDHMNE